MIESKDLRIGNLVEKTEVKFSGMKKSVYEIRNGTDLAYCVSYNPIPLSEDWLDRLDKEEFDFVGFGNRLIYKCKKAPKIKYEIAIDALYVYFDGMLINLKYYVHEWQNIHHSLTGQELQLTDK